MMIETLLNTRTIGKQLIRDSEKLLGKETFLGSPVIS
jgi:hypothetical protein